MTPSLRFSLRFDSDRRLDSFCADLDRLVYQLYDLTPDEIAIVEAASA